jgi:NADH:ubiquinone oxidoreductase subunit 5 (subunit L)/multisubunit Na+/H+ antiporter MnhA subunit
MLAMRLSRLLLTGAAAISAATLLAVLLTGDVAGYGVRVTTLTATLLLLVTGLGAVVSTYAARNLEGQRRLGRFAGLEVMVVGGLALVVLGANLVVIALAWSIAGVAMAGLVGHAGTPTARAASRLVARRVLAGDLALWLAVAVAWFGLGTVDVAGLTEPAAGAPILAGLFAVLVVSAGAVRSSLSPWHGWLPETAEAPSPVSALLHAGFVNGLGILALVLWPLIGGSTPARVLALVLGLATVVVATAQHRVRPDVKGRLASSTSSQMGYMGVQVGIGLPVGVLVHLIGHGMWKASLFLGAGGAVERVRSAPAAVVVRGRRSAVAGAALALGVVLTAATLPLPGTQSLLHAPATTLVVLVAALAAGAAVVGLLRHYPGPVVVPAALALGAASIYLVGLRVLEAATATAWGSSVPAWGADGSGLPTLALAATVVVGTALVIADHRLRAGRSPRTVARVASSTLPHTTAQRAAPRDLLEPATHAAATGAATAVDPAAVTTAVEVARATVAPAWPLHSFVASNPLAGLELLDFAEATHVGARAWGANAGISAELLRSAIAAGRVPQDAVRATVTEAGFGESPVGLDAAGSIVTEADVACAALLTDEASPHAAPAAAPSRARTVAAHHCARVYASTAWRTGATSVWESLRSSGTRLDSALGVTGAAQALAALPEDPQEALGELLARTGVPASDWATHLGRALAEDPGWAAHLAWRERLGILDPGAYTDLLAVRVALAALAPGITATVPTTTPSSVAPVLRDLGLDTDTFAHVESVIAAVRVRGPEALRLHAWERTYRAPVIESLASHSRQLAQAASALAHPHSSGQAGPDAQVVTCIDVRSERLRRQLEATGPWETLGAAGFFGLPFTFVDARGSTSERLPALLRPDHVIHESADPRSASMALDAALHGVEALPVAPFALAEAAGWIAGPYAALRTFAPRGLRALRPARPGPTGELEVVEREGSPTGFSVEELADAGAAFLTTTGLLAPAKVVVLCGHEAHAANNPHVAAYQCGACGGHAGDVSARAMSRALNDPRVRVALLERGVDIPSDTLFVAGVHDTTRDGVKVLLDNVPDEHLATIARLQGDLDLAAERSARPTSREWPARAGSAPRWTAAPPTGRRFGPSGRWHATPPSSSAHAR